MSAETTKYPLCWPEGWPRTPSHKRVFSKFGKNNYQTGHNRPSVDKGTKELMVELGRLGAREIMLSTNVKLRNDGMPYSSNVKEPEDKGAAVYFKLNKEPMCIACDQYTTIGCNITGLARTIEAMRAIERYGCSELMKRAFTGFIALPAPTIVPRTWWEVLCVNKETGADIIKSAYRHLAHKYHPDKPDTGNVEKFTEVQNAWEQVKKERGL